MSDELLSIEARDGALVLAGELDLSTVGDLEAALATAPGAPSVVIDLRALEFMDSSGLRVLIEAHKHADAAGGELVVVCPPGQVRRVLDVSGACDVLTVRDAPQGQG